MKKDKFKDLKISIITLSDRASRGEYADKSGVLIQQMVSDYFSRLGWNFTTSYLIIPDDAVLLKQEMQKAKVKKTDIVITTGGTGIGQRDITVDTVKPLLDKEIPGIMEMIRIKFGAKIPNALLSRSVAGVMNETLVYTLPGSSKAVKEYMEEIFRTLEHLIYMLHGIDVH